MTTGYRAMLAWLRAHGDVVRVGIEQTGSYGAGRTRHLALARIPLLEVTGLAGDNPDRRTSEAGFAMLLRRLYDPGLQRQDRPRPSARSRAASSATSPARSPTRSPHRPQRGSSEAITHYKHECVQRFQ